ncbi:TatD family hydrolase [Hoyosella rhizosphaerae]|uniref:Deoxyribonuclease n=1 Tax=Hoyosella rhizosphaerae TaxID=1755582 RepID=A0A916UDX4_9ACTN|nr:TatD family hydrolase [Hoyosella rhizosphaerae]MBN4925740.1 TatD family hydrolase [Hoyosella rhizosphaerae]GGC68330.1 deoxyribonuclease [Hoyosella rhizosphaerae]
MSSKKQREAPPLPEKLAPIVDAHTHLDACGAHDEASLRVIVDRAESVGVGTVVTIADDLESAKFAVQAARWDSRVFAATALHPTRAQHLDDAAKLLLEQLSNDDRTVAVGETGLDFYWPGKLESCASVEEQEDAFRWHIDLAKRVGKPLMIHNREADEALVDVLLSEGAPDDVIFHCFSSGQEMARVCIDHGWVLSLSGTVSFRNARELHEAARLIPHDQLMVETDAPYLTPHPYRGAPNESYCLPYTVRALAEIRGETAEEVAAATTATARRVYRL